jgi:SNF2 family DNA or RNA helicase
MLVLHGFWSPEDSLCLWAEDSERNVKSPSQALRSARTHPFAAPAESLTWLHSGKAGEATLLLPSLRSAPLDSPEVVRIIPRPASRSQPALLPWKVPVVSFEARAAVDALARDTDGAWSPAEGVRAGASLVFLDEVVAFAEELVDRGRVLPDVARDGAGALARWRPVVQGRDVLGLQALVRAMPPVCRAAPGHDDPQVLLTNMLDSLVDTTMRLCLPGSLTLLPPRRGRRPKRLPVGEAWLGALTGPDGHFDADADEVAALVGTLQPWRELGTDRTGPARATFRLTEVDPEPNLFDPPPEETDETDGVPPAWRLDFLLQSMEDPSLLVPAPQVWVDDGGLERWLDRPQELLLAELGRASRLYPDLVPGLQQARPSALALDLDGAHRFLSTAAPALDEAGFGVLLPSWWDRERQVGLKLSTTTPTDPQVGGTSRFGKNQLVEFRWELAVGEHTLSEEEIAALAEAKAPLVRLRGQWVAVDPDQLAQGLAFLEREPSGTKSVGEVLGLAAAHPDDTATPLPVVDISGEGWLGDLLEGATSRTLEPVEPPPWFEAELRDYQQRGLSWLAFLSSLGLGACLADDMGLGKTVQLLALEAAERSGHDAAGPSLLLCPMSLVGNWQREAARFAPELTVYAHHGRERLLDAELEDHLSDVDLVLTTYGTATRDIEELAKFEWRRVVLDEAQTIKNSLSQAAKAARRLVASHRVALTGTPVENRLSELWSIMEFLNPGMLGTAELFRKRYAIPVERHHDTETAKRLRTITRPYVLRRLKTDPAIIDDLPDKIEMKEYCRLTPEQGSLYESVVADMLDKIENTEGIERRGNVLAAMAKLKQVCNHPALLLHDRSAIGRRSGKVMRLEELVEEIVAEGDKVLCFTQYTEFAEMLLPHLAARFGTDIAYLHGGTPRKRRDELVTSFQSDGGPPVFLLSLKAGGTGLNLTAANHVVHLDRWWNPAVENQATDRAFRIGQTRNVQVRKFVCTGTLEEHIDQMIEDKKALADLVVSDGEGWLTELSTQDLRDLFTLTEEAVDE